MEMIQKKCKMTYIASKGGQTCGSWDSIHTNANSCQLEWKKIDYLYIYMLGDNKKIYLEGKNAKKKR